MKDRTSDMKAPPSKPNVCFNWTRLLLSAMLPLILGIFTIVFTLQQNAIAASTHERDRLHAVELRQQAIYDNYINTISGLVLSLLFNHTAPNQLNHIAFKTVDIMQHLNLAQKRDVIVFLYSHELNRKDKPENQRVRLSGADLANVHFFRSTRRKCSLPWVYLGHVLAPNIVFEQCDISRAGFEYAWLVEAKFINTLILSVKFFSANLTGAVFDGGNLYQANFSYAILVDTKFLGVIPGKADFTNADLFKSDLNGRDMWAVENTFVNTRLPNGSFSNVDSSNWIIDGGAEEACTNSRRKHWYPVGGSRVLDPHDTRASNKTGPTTAISGHCYFRKNVSSSMIQLLSRSNYSLLINTGQAYYNLSAYMGCTLPDRSNDNIFIDMRCWNEYFDGQVCGRLRMYKNASGFQYRSVVGPVPRGNAHFRVWVETNITSPSLTTDSIEQTCFIDDIKMFIFKKEN